MKLLINLVSTDRESQFFPVMLIRVSIGLFFFASGYYKVFTDTGFRTMAETLTEGGIPFPSQMALFVSTCEVICGFMLALGLMARLNALVLLIISTVALSVVGIDSIPPDLSPLAWYSWLMYLPESLYILMLVMLVIHGAGPIAADRLLSNFLGSRYSRN